MPFSVSSVVLDGLLVFLMMAAVAHGDEAQTSPGQASVVNTGSFTKSVQAEARLEEKRVVTSKGRKMLESTLLWHLD